MTKPKLCKNCRWAKLTYPTSMSVCFRPTERNTLITGRPHGRTAYCDLERKSVGVRETCGPDAKFFEPRPPSRLRRLLAALGLCLLLPGCFADPPGVVVGKAILVCVVIAGVVSLIGVIEMGRELAETVRRLRKLREEGAL